MSAQQQQGGDVEAIGEFGDWVVFRTGNGLVYCHKDTHEMTEEEPAVVRHMRELAMEGKDFAESAQQPMPRYHDEPAALPEEEQELHQEPQEPLQQRVSPPRAPQPEQPQQQQPRSATQSPPSSASSAQHPSGAGHRAARHRPHQVSQICFGGYGVVDSDAAAQEPIGMRGMGYDRQSVQPRSERVLLRQAKRGQQEPPSYQVRETARDVMARDDQPTQQPSRFGRRSSHGPAVGHVPGGDTCSVAQIGADRQQQRGGRAGAAAAQVQRGAGSTCPWATSDPGQEDRGSSAAGDVDAQWMRARCGRRQPAPQPPTPANPIPGDSVPSAPEPLACVAPSRGVEPVRSSRRVGAMPPSAASSCPWGTDDAEATPMPQGTHRRHLKACPQEVINEVAVAAGDVRAGPRNRRVLGAGYAGGQVRFGAGSPVQQPARGRHRGPIAVAAAAPGAPWLAQAP